MLRARLELPREWGACDGVEEEGVEEEEEEEEWAGLPLCSTRCSQPRSSASVAFNVGPSSCSVKGASTVYLPLPIVCGANVICSGGVAATALEARVCSSRRAAALLDLVLGICTWVEGGLGAWRSTCVVMRAVTPRLLRKRTKTSTCGSSNKCVLC